MFFPPLLRVNHHPRIPFKSPDAAMLPTAALDVGFDFHEPPTVPRKMVVGRLLSYWDGPFWGAMLNFGGVTMDPVPVEKSDGFEGVCGSLVAEFG